MKNSKLIIGGILAFLLLVKKPKEQTQTDAISGKIGSASGRKRIVQEIRDHGIDQLSDGVGVGTEASELHHELYNQDYYVIGRYQATKDLEAYGTFAAIAKVQDYENEQFGESNTDISEPERVLNMLAYIYGEEMLQESETLQDNWDDELSQSDIRNIIKEIS